MPKGDNCWGELYRELREQIEARRFTLSVEEIHRRTGTTVSLNELRKPGYWNACRDGGPSWDTAQKNGLELDFNVEDDGNVHFVTFFPAINANSA